MTPRHFSSIQVTLFILATHVPLRNFEGHGGKLFKGSFTYNRCNHDLDKMTTASVKIVIQLIIARLARCLTPSIQFHGDSDLKFIIDG